jgi:hypothetical protein
MTKGPRNGSCFRKKESLAKWRILLSFCFLLSKSILLSLVLIGGTVLSCTVDGGPRF